MNEVEFLETVNATKGKPGGWPACLDYKVEGGNSTIQLIKSFDKKGFRRFDAWGIAFIADYEEKTGTRVGKVCFVVKADLEELDYNFEALKRRVSYLDINNENIKFELKIQDRLIPLYERDSLFERPEEEIIRMDINERGDDDTPGRLEKDLQAYLYGKGLYDYSEGEVRSNERLAILGEDFLNLKQGDFGILREFPTGVFRNEISQTSRILPTEFVDLVTLNKKRELSIVELKVNDSQLEVISQILDYSLFFRSYFEKLAPIIEQKFDRKLRNNIVMCYIVNNSYHPRFDDLIKYYSTKNKTYDFCIKKIVLGYTAEI